jgi:hypothetical protein
VRDAKPSSSAQTLTLARAHLHRTGVVDDPWAHQMLGPGRRTIAAALAAAGGPGSRLAVNFTASGEGSVSPLSRVVARALRTTWRLAGEPTHRWATQANVGPLLVRTRWMPTGLLTGPALAARFLVPGTVATSGLNPEAFCVSAERSAQPGSAPAGAG